MRKFKIGDRVKINYRTSQYHGYHCTIIELGQSFGHPRINYVLKTTGISLTVNEVNIESDIQWYREQRLKKILG